MSKAASVGSVPESPRLALPPPGMENRADSIVASIRKKHEIKAPAEKLPARSTVGIVLEGTMVNIIVPGSPSFKEVSHFAFFLAIRNFFSSQPKSHCTIILKPCFTLRMYVYIPWCTYACHGCKHDTSPHRSFSISLQHSVVLFFPKRKKNLPVIYISSYDTCAVRWRAN